MEQKLLQQGAEAKIILNDNWVIKDRISKSYRIPELDKSIRKRRTKAETKLLKKASEIIDSPIPKDYSDKNFDKITMPYINGKKLSQYLDKFLLKKQKQIMKTVGKQIALLHKNEIIHGDLTTSNMILVENEKTNFEKNLDELKKLKLPKNEYIIIGGGPLAIRNLRDTEDIDILVTKRIWEKLAKKHKSKKGKIRKELRIININNIEIIWDPKQPEKEFPTISEVIENFPCLKLKKVIERKKEYGRKKDLEDIKLINNYLQNKKEVINSQKIFFIDFGLGYISRKIEDKAVDLHLLKQALEAKHFKHWKELFEEVSKAYEKTLSKSEAKKVFERIIAVERRGRYRH